LPTATWHTPEFYFSADIVGCGTLTSPGGAPTANFTALVGSAVSILTDDFQTDQGWTVADDAGLTTGTWERVVPVFSNRGDPPVDEDGSGMCYVTDNATDADVDNGTTFLTSAPMDLTGGALITYSYWVNSTSSASFGIEDFLQVEIATNAAGTNWTLLRDYRTIEPNWRSDTIAVGTEVAATATVRIRFAMADLSPGDIIEGGIDAVEIFSLDCTESPFFCDAADGSLSSCPCANPGDPLTGCDIAQATGGVRLDVSQQNTSPQNRATLIGTGFPAATLPSAVMIRAGQLDPAAPIVFGDGLRCVGSSVVRLAATTAIAGVSQHTLGHGTGAGAGTFYYQLWFRNTPISFCDPTAAFNLSNGRTLVWP